MTELLKNVLLDNYAMFMEIFGVIFMMRISTHVPEWEKKMTRHALLLQLVVAITYHVEQSAHDYATLSVLRPILTASNYSLYPMILYFLTRILMEEKSPRRKNLLLLPELLSVPLYVTSQWTHLVCWFTPDNHYMAGPLKSLPYAVVVFYSFVFLYQNTVYFRKFNRIDRWTAAYTILVPLIGMILLRTMRDDGNFSALLTSAIVLYYMFIYIHMAKIDPLTSLLNRKCCYEDMQNRARNITAVVSVDMNDLKYFNDNMGHQAGDKALKTVAEVLRNHCDKGGTAYRVGGDEFIILYLNAGDDWVRRAISNMREKMGQTPYTCAFGYAMVEACGSVEAAMVAADQAMYADKAAIKVKQKQLKRRSGN